MADPMTPERLRELEALVEAATPGPWEADTQVDGDAVVWAPSVREVCADGEEDAKFVGNIGPSAIARIGVGFDFEKTDAHFIAAARQALPDLLAYVRRLEAELAAHTKPPASGGPGTGEGEG